MSEQEFDDLRPEEMEPLTEEEKTIANGDMDEFLRSLREELDGVPEATDEPTLVMPASGVMQQLDTEMLTQPFETPKQENQPDKPKKAKNNGKKKRRLPAATRALIYIFCVVTCSVLLAMFAWYCALDVLALTKPNREVTVTIPENASMEEVADLLYENGLIEYKWLFRLYCGVSHAENKIDPGVYTVNNLFDYHALVNGLIGTAGTRDTEEVTVPEGYECEQIFALLEQHGVCTADKLRKTAADYEFDYWFLEGLPYGDPERLEGYLFPDTYQFYVDDEPDRVLRKFLNNFENKFNEEFTEPLDKLNASLRQKMQENGFTSEEIEAGLMDERKVVIVASLIEKETGGVRESGTIASVIYNRLCSKLYPLLQLDATIQYVLDERKEVLTEEDLQVDSPYNTYRNAGLTPGPISNPGLSSLRAAINPENTDYFFYALAQDGYHHFSASFYDHQAFLEGEE